MEDGDQGQGNERTETASEITDDESPGGGYLLADDTLVQVRANNWREDQVSTDNPPVYKVVMAIDEESHHNRTCFPRGPWHSTVQDIARLGLGGTLHGR
jgi:hypothetical protein